MVRPDQALLVGIGILAVLMPAILMLANTLGETLLPKSSLGAKVSAFLGDPMIAMLVYLRGGSTEKLREALGASLKPIAGILLIAGGGAFQQILVKAKVADAMCPLIIQSRKQRPTMVAQMKPIDIQGTNVINTRPTRSHPR